MGGFRCWTSDTLPGQISTAWQQWRWWRWWYGHKLCTCIEMVKERYYGASYGHSMGHQEYYNINLFIAGFVSVIEGVISIGIVVVVMVMMMIMMMMKMIMMMMMMMIRWWAGRGCIHPSRGFPCQHCYLCIFISLSIGSPSSSPSLP